MIKITINKKKCVECGTCIEACPIGIFVMHKGKVIVDKQHMDDCIGCLQCELTCPEDAIRVWNKKPLHS